MKSVAIIKAEGRNGVTVAASLHEALLRNAGHPAAEPADADVLYLHRFPQKLPPGIVNGRVAVGYWCVESTSASPDFIPHLRALSLVMTPSEQSASALRVIAGDVPVVVVPHPIPHRAPVDRTAHQTFNVLTCAASPLARKGLAQTIRAWVAAFPVATYPDARYTVKLRNVTANALDIIQSQIATLEDNRIQVITTDMSDAEMEQLYRDADCYFQLHFAGAFELHCAEAASFGLPVICTGFGGVVDYLPAQSLVTHTPEPSADIAHSELNKTGDFAKPDIADAVTKLRRLYNDPAARAALATACRNRVRQACNPETIQAAMSAAIEGLPATPPEAVRVPGIGLSATPPARQMRDRLRGREHRPRNMVTLRPGYEIVGGMVPADNAPIVASHRRSGTHHLGEFLRRNWPEIRAWYKTHDFPERLPKDRPIFFMVRNPVTALHSTFSWFKTRGGSANPRIAAVFDAITFGQFLDGEAGHLIGYADLEFNRVDNCCITRGMFYDPIAYWRDLLLAHKAAGSHVLRHDALIAQPAATAQWISAIAFGGRLPDVIDPVPENVALSPSNTTVEAALADWAGYHRSRLESVVAQPDVVAATGIASLNLWNEA